MIFSIKGYIYASIIAAVLFLAALMVGRAAAEVNFFTPIQTGSYQTFSFFNATTTNATSTNLTGGGGWFNIAGAKNVALYFSRGDTTGQGNSGSSKFSVQVTPDGTNWYNYNTLNENVASTTSGWSTRFETVSGTSTTITIMQNRGFYGVRCIVQETTDGEHTCSAAAEF